LALRGRRQAQDEARHHEDDDVMTDWRLAQTRLAPRWRADENLRAGFIFARKFEKRARGYNESI